MRKIVQGHIADAVDNHVRQRVTLEQMRIVGHSVSDTGIANTFINVVAIP